jgi:MFS family permease
LVALIGRIAGGFVPPALAADDPEIPGYPHRGMDWHIVRASIALVSATLHVRRLFLAILSISFFWAMGAVLAAQFPPLVKNVFYANQSVATLFLAVFSVGVAIGSVAINRMLKGQVSARFAPSSALMMGVFVLLLYVLAKDWSASPELVGTREFLRHPLGWAVVLDLLGIAIAGGMFVVPLYAFLTTTVPKSETARTVAANNIVNSGAMVVATLMLTGLVLVGVSVAETLFLVALGSIVAAWLGFAAPSGELVPILHGVLLACLMFVYFDTNPLAAGDGSHCIEAALDDGLARHYAFGRPQAVADPANVRRYRIITLLHLLLSAALFWTWWQ